MVKEQQEEHERVLVAHKNTVENLMASRHDNKQLQATIEALQIRRVAHEKSLRYRWDERRVVHGCD